MAHYLDLFTPETWAKFLEHGSTISGFRERQRKTAERLKPGDIFLCYIVKVSRWAGILEVVSEVFEDDAPIFADPDPYTIRFQVKPIVTLPLEQAIPIDAEGLWEHLSFTREMAKRVSGWAQHANLRASLRKIPAADGKLIVDALSRQSTDRKFYPLSQAEKYRIGSKKTIQTATRAVIVEVPDDEDEEQPQAATPTAFDDARESHKIQATLAVIGAAMGFRVWIPAGDRQKVLALVQGDVHETFLEVLPLNYDDATLRTIQQIDVIWLHNRSMARAFEVEHTTAIYSGLLRMADLLALQPNMDIRLHIVAPTEKREKVLREIRRPVFSLLDRGPLYESCTFIPYEAVQEISSIKHLSHMNDSLLEEYEEFAQEE